MARRSPLEVARERAEIEKARLDAATAKAKRRALRAYEASSADNYHPRRKESRSGDSVMAASTDKLRSIARYLDENHDLAIAIFDDLTNKVIGNGLILEPQMRDRRGELVGAQNDQVRAAYREWLEAAPETSRTMTYTEGARLAFRTWVRDGEVLIHHIEGTRADIRHRGGVPYSFELLEPDFLPFSAHRPASAGVNRVTHGVEKNAWREPVAYHLLTEHPGDLYAGLGFKTGDLRRVPADELTHLKLTKRLHQTRGITVLHGVLTRLEDIKEYDDSERIAARVASAFTAMITRASDFVGATVENVNGASRRVLEMAPGMIFDGLLPGESVQTLSSDRPSAQYDAYRQANERSAAGGSGTSRSSISRRYDGNYSSQRQELVESEVLYGHLRAQFCAGFDRTIYRRFIDMGIASGRISIGRAVDVQTLYDCEIVPPATSWIDPMKEVQADILAIKAKLISRHQVIRRRGLDPIQVDKQISADTLAMDNPAPAKKPSAKLEAVS
jgi:lambda family phage portal protein